MLCRSVGGRFHSHCQNSRKIRRSNVSLLHHVETGGSIIFGCRACYVFPLDVMARCAFGANIENLGKSDDVFMKNAKIASKAFTRSPLMILPCKETLYQFEI